MGALGASLLLGLLCLWGSEVSAQDNLVAASVGSPMELSSPFIANTPASNLNGTTGSGIQITQVTRDPSPQPQPGKDLPITATLTGNPAGATLIYLTNFGAVQNVSMNPGSGGTFSASIPSSTFKAGDMVRWAVMSGSSRSPALNGGDRYFGTVIADSSVNYDLPVMYWFTDDVTASTSDTGHNGTAVSFLGRFYDNLFVRRKGVTSQSWPKPKLKFKLANNEFIYEPNMSSDQKKIDDFDLNSLYYEPGQKSYMREAIAYQVLQDVGAVSAINYHIILYLNGAFYGLYTYTENDDKYYLERNRLSDDGLLVKATSGQGGGLTPFYSEDQSTYLYKQQNQKKHQSVWSDLYQFTQGIAGAGNEVRSLYVFDNVELSETINTMAVLTMLLTQDRCTKNYLVYRDPNTTKWQLMGYDLKSAMNDGAGYMGISATDYCTLICDQWTSPLYCDRNHPQDVNTDLQNPFNAIQPGNIGRRLLQNGPSMGGAPGPGGIPDNGPTGVNVNITNPNVNLVAMGAPANGVTNTWNYLIDLITQVPATRAMYMRRLRTLTDYYYPTGRLAGMVTTMYNRIQSAADMDNQKWGIGNITLGYLQLTQEQIPTRQMQLLEQYAPGGSQPLLPASQPDSNALVLARIDITTAMNQRYVEIMNPLSYAVDVSNWRLSGAVTASVKLGTVIAAGNSLIVAADSGGFRTRNTSPMLGQGFQVIGQLTGSFAAGQNINLIDQNGNTVISKSSTGSSPTTAG